jgi:hypothetical protein
VELPRTDAVRFIAPLREGGSLPALVEASDSGMYVLKLRGAAQGLRSLVAEIIAGELARALGLAVPDLKLVELDPDIGKNEPDEELRELLMRSAGLNVGVDFLPSALPFNPAVGAATEATLAADIVWFDALVMNVDRTARNPNMLMWHKRLWLIDHGASLYLHHRAREATKDRDPFPQTRDHVMLPYAGSIHEADTRLAPLVTKALLTDVVSAVPHDWLDGWTASDYVDHLSARLAGPRTFAQEAEGARERR